MLPASRQKCLVSSSQDEKIWRPFVKADSSMAVHEGENVLLSVSFLCFLHLSNLRDQ